ncbi:hypothetical protein GUITHDRAFT_153911 [Guillardia theta CCMP2712]|uniref:Uncharacterized protein n=1 Tax=Guillardia theta (strain CCMP2712) TaxID=905079 RepID=L1IY60_GUITC|nr:hypothetical protein GUITHDRAFT_153911 [Guillardia theta CCMP2712]EKX41047.1 hypothetical protein GUITHDRAFT_153911 [Guillardia theta CCMP2712]|eukprot:XP_005828027.1 hypothetical protein GUITHDRAFT_153911 [Guillardia theta CCMP2712]
MDGICCQSKCRVKSACLVEQDRLPEDVEESRGALGRADSFIVLNKSRDAETDRKLLSFAERFFRRLVVFEQSDDAIRYRTRSMLRGEMVVGLDRPNKVISWDGSQTLLDKQVRCARMGIVEYWRAKAYKELQRQRDELDSIDKELKEIIKNCNDVENNEMSQSARLTGKKRVNTDQEQPQEDGEDELRPRKLFRESRD